MKRSSAIILGLALLIQSGTIQAGPDVKFDSETTVKFGGALGGVVKFFGGSKPQKSTTYLKGDQLRTDSGERSDIIDLDKEVFITIDHKKKEYTSMTFEEMRRQMEEAMRKAQEEAKKEESQKQQPSVQAKFNVSVKESGRKQVIDGHEVREVVLTMTIEGEDTTGAKGGLVTTSNVWTAKTLSGYGEVQDFYRRFAEKFGSEWTAGTMKMFEAAFQSDPRTGEAMKELQEQSRLLEGVPLLTEMTMDVVSTQPPESKSTEPEKIEEEKEEKKIEKPSVGGLFGKLGKKKAEEDRKAKEEKRAKEGGVNRSNLMTTLTKLMGFSTGTLAGDMFQVPGGYKEKKVKKQ